MSEENIQVILQSEYNGIPSFEEFVKLMKKKGDEISGNSGNPIDFIPSYIKILKNFDPTGISSSLIDILEEESNKSRDESIYLALYSLFKLNSSTNERLKLLNDEFKFNSRNKFIKYLNQSIICPENIDFFRNLFINNILDPKIPNSKINDAYNLVSTLSQNQIQILKYCYDKQKSFTYNELRKDRNPMTSKEISKLFPEFSEDYITADLRILNSKGLLDDWGLGRMDYKGPTEFIITNYSREVIKLITDTTNDKYE